MSYPKAWIQYLCHFHGDRDYFECHEVLEEYWKKKGGGRNSIWVGWIQLAVGFYHYRRGNNRGALRTLKKAQRIFSSHGPDIEALGCDYHALQSLLSREIQLIEQDTPSYKSIVLPIKDEQLLTTCKRWCSEQQVTWGSSSPSTNEALIHRHKLRDRTDVLKARDDAAKKRS